jgi:hypothetical protein
MELMRHNVKKFTHSSALSGCRGIGFSTALYTAYVYNSLIGHTMVERLPVRGQG